MSRKLKILLITDHSIHEKSGPALRMDRTVAGLRAIGDLHVVYLTRDDWNVTWEGDYVSSVSVQHDSVGIGLIRWLLSKYPRSARYRNIEHLRTTVGKILDQGWDLVWVYRGRPYTLIENRTLDVPVVVDLDDLYDLYYKLVSADVLPAVGMVKRHMLKFIYALDIKRWASLQQKISKEVTLVTVNSKHDKNHLAQENVRIVVNGYPKRQETGRWEGKPCRILMVGGYHYPPNAAAAQLLAASVLPLVRAKFADAELILIGQPGPNIPECFMGLAGVRYEGQVESVDPWYRSASVALTVVKSGAGSRLKVVEAMAQKVPLVSTRFASQGFDLVDGVDVLFAESAEEIAQSIIKVYADSQLCEGLVESAHRKFMEHFEASIVESTITTVANAGIQKGTVV